MSNYDSSADGTASGMSSDARKAGSSPGQNDAASQGAAGAAPRRGRYPDMQSAVRSPIHLPISVKSDSGESRSQTQNISANGVLFQVEADMPVGSMVDFT